MFHLCPLNIGNLLLYINSLSSRKTSCIGDIFKAPTTIEDFSTEAEREIEEMLKLEQNGGRQENTGIG